MQIEDTVSPGVPIHPRKPVASVSDAQGTDTPGRTWWNFPRTLFCWWTPEETGLAQPSDGDSRDRQVSDRAGEAKPDYFQDPWAIVLPRSVSPFADIFP
jgi:hypothetical protein